MYKESQWKRVLQEGGKLSSTTDRTAEMKTEKILGLGKPRLQGDFNKNHFNGDLLQTKSLLQ